jgi:hypothetical protein
MAAVLASYPSVASHLSAGWLWGLLRSQPGTVHLTSRSPRPGGRPFVIHRSDLAAVDRTIHDGIPVTSPARTILDLAVDSHPKTIARHIERADAAKAFDLGEMRELLDRSVGHRGEPMVRVALDAYRPDLAFTRSGLERRFLALVRDAGLPEPSMNSFVAGHEVDAYWPDARFGVEIDAYATHGSRLSFETDRVRDDELLLAGVETIRVTEARLDQAPGAVIDSLRRHLAKRGAPQAED